VTLVATMRAIELHRVSVALARTASWGGNRLVNPTTNSTHVPAASPVMARPMVSPLTLPVVPIVHAPSPTRPRPMMMNGLHHPNQSAVMPNGKRMNACHKPYMERTVPTNAKSWVLLWT
jgi:hypothetical protein